MNTRFNRTLALLSGLLFSMLSGAQTPVLRYDTIIPASAGLSLPVEVLNASDGSNRLFIVEQDGLIKIHNGVSVLPTPFLNLTTVTNASGEQGLLSMAFHPNHLVNRYFFVYYTNLSGSITIARYQVSLTDINQADPLSGVVLMTIPKPFTNHNGGHLQFGPDGYLYFGTGDGGSGGDPNNNAQNGNSLLGKMIRINVNQDSIAPYYNIPPDNPYIANATVLDEIWALGVRNPWRWSFDRLTGDMWIGEVGQGAREEVDFRPAGATGGINYGWRCYEGNQAYNTTGCAVPSTYVFPIFDYPHNSATGGFSITGGYVYRGPEFPTMYGQYICADYVSGNTWIIRPNGSGGWISSLQAGLPGSISSFGEGENGVLYAVKRSPAIILKVATTGAVLPLRIVSFTGNARASFNELSWKTANEAGLRHFRITYSETGTAFQPVATVTASNNNNGNNYRFTHHTYAPKTYYRLETIEANGHIQYSPIIKVNKQNDEEQVKAFAVNGGLSVISNKPVRYISLFSMAGKNIYSFNTENRQGYFNVPVPGLASGIYTVVIHTADKVYSKTLVIAR